MPGSLAGDYFAMSRFALLRVSKQGLGSWPGLCPYHDGRLKRLERERLRDK